jgi:DNA/RNA-binding domain of Phe-tRNA-synthetase-like protein
MKVSVDNELLSRLIHIRLGLLQGTVNCLPSPGELTEMIRHQADNVKTEYCLDEINKIENISAARKAYKLSGNDPNRYRPSAESLYRRIVKGYGIYQINNVVDSLNLTSLQSAISIGGYDLNSIHGDISLGIGKPGEPYEGIGRGKLNISAIPVLRDLSGAFGNPTSDSERTKITPVSSKILFIFFDFGIDYRLSEYMNHCGEWLEKLCSAKEVQQQLLTFDCVHNI